MIGLVLVVALGLVFVAAFWWALPRDTNPGRQGIGGYRSGFGEIETHRALERARAAAEEMQRAEREARGEEEPGASWMDQPGAFGDQPPAEPPQPPAARHRAHREWEDDLPSAEDIARYGGEADAAAPTAAADENADPRRHVAAEDDENADLPDDEEATP